jgi:hypothetical protein
MSMMTIDQILRAAEQLSPEEQAILIQQLQEHTRQRVFPVDDKMELLRAAQLDVQVNQEPSVRRVDWYDDDGR